MLAFAAVGPWAVVSVAVEVIQVALVARVRTSRECFLQQISRDVTGPRGPEWDRDAYAVTLPETRRQGSLVRRREGMAVDLSIGGFRRGEQALADVV